MRPPTDRSMTRHDSTFRGADAAARPGLSPYITHGFVTLTDVLAGKATHRVGRPSSPSVGTVHQAAGGVQSISVAAPATRATLLDRWAGLTRIGAIHAAVARFGPEQRMALRAFIKPLAGVGGHGFGFRETALWAGQGGFQGHRVDGSAFALRAAVQALWEQLRGAHKSTVALTSHSASLLGRPGAPLMGCPPPRWTDIPRSW